MSEQWLPIAGYEGLYEVSDFGRVRSVDRVVADRNGATRRLSGAVMKENVKPSGYRSVMLSRDGLQTRFHIHRLVLQAFVGRPPAGMECCHNDGNPANNALSNLRWGTPSDNRYDTVRHGNHWATRKTHCKNGHAFTSENTIDNHGNRGCRRCRDDQLRAHYLLHRQGRVAAK